MDASYGPDDHFYINGIFWLGRKEVVEEEDTLCPNVEIHSGKASMGTYTVSVEGPLEANVNQLKPCLNMI